MPGKTAQKTWSGWGRVALPTGAAVRCLHVENGWRAGTRSLLLRRPGGSIRGREEAAFVLGASQPRCQQGPLPLPLASDTVWQKQCYSRKRGVPPSADRQQGFSNLPPPLLGPCPPRTGPFSRPWGASKSARVALNKRPRRKRGVGGGIWQVLGPPAPRGGVPNVRRRRQATGEMFWFCLWLCF